MKQRFVTCAECRRKFPAVESLHCTACGKCYCRRCADRLAVCECTEDLTYFD